MKEFRVCLTGGATGGHFFPLIFVARELKRISKEKNLNLKIFYLGSRPFKKEILKDEGIDVYLIPEVKLRKYFSFKNFIDLLKLPFNFIFAFYYLFKFLPDVIFSKGGPGSLGVILAGWLLRLSIVIHESDSIPGLTNKFSSFFAKKIFLAFEEAKKYFSSKNIEVVGQPIDSYLVLEPITTKDYERYGLDAYRKIILILGGSQGSKFLNDLILDSLKELLKIGQVVHQTGEKNFNEIYLYAKGVLTVKELKDYHPYPLFDHDDLIYLMKLSDLIIARAGSGTIFEIAALKKPSILIPIEEKVAGLHQIINARIYSKTGAAYLIEEENAKPHLLLTVIRKILSDKNLLDRMQEEAGKFAKIDASQKIAEKLIDYFHR